MCKVLVVKREAPDFVLERPLLRTPCTRTSENSVMAKFTAP
jgi:hypothetical protein